MAHRGNRNADLTFPPGSVRFNCNDGRYEAGDHSTAGIDAWLLDSVDVVESRNLTEFRFRLPSRYSPLRFKQLLEDGADFVIPKVPFRPSYINPGGTPKLVRSLWTWQTDPTIPTNEDAYREQQEQFEKPFRYAKPTALLRRIIEITTEPGDLVLDPFAGSGTTAVAAIQTGRRYLVIEEQEPLVNSYIHPRIRRAIAETVNSA